MTPLQYDFIEFCLHYNVLKFGNFTLKSGRKSPYFFNIGEIYTGTALAELGGFYAHTIANCALEFSMLFGPAYKGIPLACSTSIALIAEFDKDVPYAFNRKEEKDHGEGGQIIGAPLSDNVLVIDDVITAGTAFREVAEYVDDISGLIVALDRQEVGESDETAMQEIKEEFDIQVASIITFEHLVEYLEQKDPDSLELTEMKEYQAQYS